MKAFLSIKSSFSLAILFILISGFINVIDGSIARYLNETSQFGALLDSSIDRLTTTFIYFYLSSIYSKHWQFFANVGFIELLSDSLKYCKSNIFFQFNIVIIQNDQVDTDLSCLEPYIMFLKRISWFSSDFFYLILFIASSFYNNKPELSDILITNSKKTNNTFIQDLLGLNNKISKKLEIKCFKCVFKFIFLFCFLCAIVKYFMNLNNCFSILYEIIQLDVKYYDKK